MAGLVKASAKKIISGLQVLDLSGRQVKQICSQLECGNNTAVNSYTVDLTGLSGVFILSTEVEGRVYTQKVLVK
jgi:hypothetical protein